MKQNRNANNSLLIQLDNELITIKESYDILKQATCQTKNAGPTLVLPRQDMEQNEKILEYLFESWTKEYEATFANKKVNLKGKNLLETAAIATVDSDDTSKSMAIAASFVQIAANNILRLASDIASVYAKVNAEETSTHLKVEAHAANKLANETAFCSEIACNSAMLASIASAQNKSLDTLNNVKTLSAGVSPVPVNLAYDALASKVMAGEIFEKTKKMILDIFSMTQKTSGLALKAMSLINIIQNHPNSNSPAPDLILQDGAIISTDIFAAVNNSVAALQSGLAAYLSASCSQYSCEQTQVLAEKL